MRVYRYGLSTLLNEDAMKLPSLLFSFQGRINQLSYWLVAEVKRWPDRDRTGWWALVYLIYFIGQIWVLIQCGILRGTAGANRFGKDPLPHG